MGDRAGICLASFHIIRRSSLGPSLEEKAFSDSEAEPLDKIKGCKAAVLWVKAGGLAGGGGGAAASGTAHEQDGITGGGDRRPLRLSAFTPTSV